MMAGRKDSNMSRFGAKAMLSVGVILLSLDTAPASGQENVAAALVEMRGVIARQQEQIRAQAQVLENLQRRLEALSTHTVTAAAGSTPAASSQKATPATAKSASMAAQPEEKAISLSLSGQVNRALLYADDGNIGEVFHVDNDHSSTRVRFAGNARISGDFSIGSEIEVQMESNSTASVSQDDNDHAIGGASFTERKLQLWLDSKRFGRLWLGQGSTASDSTSQTDLSGTTLIAYSNSPDEMSGGIKFYSPSGGTFGPAIKDVFSNFDGLSRDDRIRYDSPGFNGVRVSASHISGGAYDVALRYAAKFDGVKTAAAIGFAEPSSISATVDNQLGGSVSMLHDSGLNGTFAAGRQVTKAGGSNPGFLYGKLGYIAKFFDFGETAFAIDFTRNENVALDGDEAVSYGFGAVQNLKDYGVQFYGGIRNHELDRTGSDFDDVLTSLAGARVKF